MLIQRVGGVRDGGMSDKQRTPGRGKKRMRSLCPSVYTLSRRRASSGIALAGLVCCLGKKEKEKKKARVAIATFVINFPEK